MITTNDKLANTLIGNNRDSVGALRSLLVPHQYVCRLSDAYANVPANAQYVAMRINGATLTLRSTNDVLTWVCKKMSIYRASQLQPLLKSRKLSWFKANGTGMNRPYRISYNCYVDLDGDFHTSLSRAAKILEWLSWPKDDVLLTYELPVEQIKAPSLGCVTSQAPQISKVVRPSKMEPTTRPHVQMTQLGGTENQIYIFSFKHDKVNELVNTEPISLLFKGNVFGLYRKWFLLPAKISATLEKMWPGKLKRIVAEHGVPNMGIKCSGMIRELYADEAGIWYESSGTVHDFVHQARNLCRLFAVDLGDVSITYVKVTVGNCSEGKKQPEGCSQKCPTKTTGVIPSHVDTELKDVPTDVLVRTVLLEILKQGRDDGETWEDFLSAPRCRRELGLSNSLLHKMKLWENAEKYAGEYSALDDEADYMILSDLGRLDRDGFLGCVQNLGISMEEVCSLLHVKLPRVPAPTPPPSPVPEPQVKLGSLKDLILKNYPRGIVLNNATTALLEKEVGEPLDEFDLNRIRSEMFARADGTLLYPEMVIGMDGLERMKNRAKELLAKYRMFAYGCLWNEFAGEMRNLLDERDFARFFDRFFARDVGMVYASRDRLGKMMCLGEIHDFSETVGEKVRSVLAECGDAVSIDNLLVQLPYLSREVIEYVGQEVLHDVVAFDVEGERYLKLLEAYFLPDEFSRVVSDFVAITEASQGVVSIVLLESEFESRYGEGFRVNYALEDESVFKQVVLMSFRGRVHDWNRDMFLPYGKRGNSNVAEMFLQSHQDLFHEEEFFKYALESRGLHNTGMLILTFLRKHCIRMSREWWISLDGFDKKFELSDEQYDAIGHILNNSVGNARFKSIIELGEEVYEQLPVLQSGEKTYPWNPYVLTSIAVQKVRNACVVNDEPSPYTVTAMILPLNSGEVGDVVDYVLRTFPKGYFVDAEAAFDYLRVNHIRLTKTKKLIAKIKAQLEMP